MTLIRIFSVVFNGNNTINYLANNCFQVLKNILMLNFQEITIFASTMQGKNILMQDFHP